MFFISIREIRDLRDVICYEIYENKIYFIDIIN